MNNKAIKKEEEMKKVKIMLCSLPASKPLTQNKPPKKPTQTPTIKKEVNKKQKNEVKQIIPEDKREALKPKEPIKKPKEPVKKPTEPLKPKIKQSKPKEPEIKPKNKVKSKEPIKPTEPLKPKPEPTKPKEVEKKPIKPEIKQTILKEPEELQEEKAEPAESVEEKESRLAQEYINEHIKKISKLLSENLYYPRSARKRNIQGKVMVKFKLSRSAKAYDIEVTSSQSEILSRAAIRTIENLSEKFPSPQEELILHVPITYKLNR